MASRTPDSAGSAAPPRRTGRVRALASAVETVTRPVFGRRGLADGAIVQNWAIIVGPQFAAVTAPEKLAFAAGNRRDGTLHLRVADGGIALQLQHLEPLLVERINSYFGYRAVGRLHFKQGPVARLEAPLAVEPPPLNAAQEADLAACLAVVDDPDLKAVLDSLGRSVLARRRSGG